MPRGERPLDEGDGELLRFAADLRRLREKAGSPPYRSLAARAHYSAATLSDAAGGRKLPTLGVTLAYVRACDGDVAEWETRWRSLSVADTPVAEESPYVGLSAFQAEDADRFFGRERLTSELVDLVRSRRFVGVFGASGSGKSSVLRAGLASALDDPVVVFAPGAHPVEECAARLAPVLGESAVTLRSEFLADPAHLWLRIRQRGPDLVLVVDQFEEIFTLCSAEEREWFVRALTGGPRVVIGVRADFYAHCERHTDLVEALRGGQVMVGPMTADELRQAIVEPAARVGAKVEASLLAQLVADASGQAAVLPLLSHALVETWHRRRGITLSLNGYVAAGGIEHAIARTADQMYDALPPHQRTDVRQVFQRLVVVSEGPQDTKRRVSRRELEVSDSVLERLAGARLISLDREHVELAHEALIRSWPRLREWLAHDREGLRIHRELTEAATTWEALGRDAGALYRGVRLTIARNWHTADRGLTVLEKEFLDASLAADAAVVNAARRRRTRVQRVAASVLLAVFGFAAIAAAISAFGPTLRSHSPGDRPFQIAFQLNDSEPALALQIGLYADRLAPTSESRLRLSELAARTYYLRFREPDGTVPSVPMENAGAVQLVRGLDDAHWALFDLRDGEWREIRGRPAGQHGKDLLALAAQEAISSGPLAKNQAGMFERICAMAHPRITREQWEAHLPGVPYAPPCPS